MLNNIVANSRMQLNLKKIFHTYPRQQKKTDRRKNSNFTANTSAEIYSIIISHRQYIHRNEFCRATKFICEKIFSYIHTHNTTETFMAPSMAVGNLLHARTRSQLKLSRLRMPYTICDPVFPIFFFLLFTLL